MAKKTSMKKRGSVVQKDSALHLVSEIQQSMNTYNDANGIIPTYKNFSENPFKEVQEAIEKEKKMDYDKIFDRGDSTHRPKKMKKKYQRA